MSAYYEIYARAKGDTAGFLADVGEILGGQPQPIEGSDLFLIETPTAFVDIDLLHGLEDAAGIPYSSYPLCVTIRDRDSLDERAKVVADTIYQRLMATGQYECFMVYNLTEQLTGLDGT
jgi:hypothetical protein